MCAAPGSKTFQMLEMIHSGSTAATGLVVANDADAKRCNLLAHQTKRMCSPSMLVSNHDGQVRSRPIVSYVFRFQLVYIFFTLKRFTLRFSWYYRDDSQRAHKSPNSKVAEAKQNPKHSSLRILLHNCTNLPHNLNSSRQELFWTCPAQHSAAQHVDANAELPIGAPRNSSQDCSTRGCELRPHSV
jgi:hypothetical protein